MNHVAKPKLKSVSPSAEPIGRQYGELQNKENK
jgi:hypothetical protein